MKSLEEIKLQARFESRAVLLAIGIIARLEVKEELETLTESEKDLLNEARIVIEAEKELEAYRKK